MNTFPFNQPPKTKDCGYRCLYYAIQPPLSYEQWLDQFRFFMPVKSGILFQDIITVLDYYGIKSKFTNLTDNALFIIYSGVWLHHGHYFCYDNGVVYCSTQIAPYPMNLDEVVARLEAKTVDGAFRCLRVER